MNMAMAVLRGWLPLNVFVHYVRARGGEGGRMGGGYMRDSRGGWFSHGWASVWTMMDGLLRLVANGTLVRGGEGFLFFSSVHKLPH